MRRSERPLLLLPRPLLFGFLILFALQVGYHQLRQQSFEAEYQALENPLDLSMYRTLAMGSEELLGYLLIIRLQLHDNQLGRHFRYDLIDYDRLIRWLDLVSEINRDTEYPMLLASRIYSQTGDPARLRKILAFIERRFGDNPQLHWRRLAEASVIAKHKLGDLERALSYAERLARLPTDVEMPQWARDMEFLLLAELNEVESAIVIIEAMLQSGSVTDPVERRFLESQLSEFRQTLFESQQKAGSN